MPGRVAVKRPRAGGGRRRREEVRRLVTRLAGRLRWPAVPVAVSIPAGIAAAADRLEPLVWYELGNLWEFQGAELAMLCGALAALAESQRADDLGGVERALSRLCAPSWD